MSDGKKLRREAAKRKDAEGATDDDLRWAFDRLYAIRDDVLFARSQVEQPPLDAADLAQLSKHFVEAAEDEVAAAAIAKGFDVEAHRRHLENDLREAERALRDFEIDFDRCRGRGRDGLRELRARYDCLEPARGRLVRYRLNPRARHTRAVAEAVHAVSALLDETVTGRSRVLWTDVAVDHLRTALALYESDKLTARRKAQPPFPAPELSAKSLGAAIKRPEVQDCREPGQGEGKVHGAEHAVAWLLGMSRSGVKKICREFRGVGPSD